MAKLQYFFYIFAENQKKNYFMITAPDYREIETIKEYLSSVPYYVTPQNLYTAGDLYDGFNSDDEESIVNCYDNKVYSHYIKTGKNASTANEALARSLHDHSINVALYRFLAEREPKLTIGIMGGHALLRTDKMFREIALISKRLTEMGFLMLSGGGPGAMEATHLGAWLAGYDDAAVDYAIEIMSAAPAFSDKGWLKSAFQIISKFPQDKYDSLAIPTWLYGHEPSTPFATNIAKFFENSIREDEILTLAYGGIIYTPGSAGTMQEIFQDAVQNHYQSFGFASPMVFMGKEFWTKEFPVYSLLEKLVNNGKYKNLILSLSDNSDEIIKELVNFKESWHR